MSFLYIKTELSAKIFEYDIIKEQFENIFTKNADKILKKYEYYLNITNKNIVFNETYMGKEVFLNKVKELTKNYIITEVISEIFENGGYGIIFDKVCTMLLVNEDKILSYILDEAIYQAFKNSLLFIKEIIDSSIDISYFCDKEKK
ncbi:MAG: hypothetical protein IJ094_09030 [Bacilli bacterium]|nr:hypothetical protein [Bacilli bacterium]